MANALLTRDAFRDAVFARDNHKCVFCGKPAKDAHHILDRKLFSDGGYYLENGASVCDDCHMKCETTEYSVELVREMCGITSSVLPSGITPDMVVDKWGNHILQDGRKVKGPLFNDTAVQRLLKSTLWEYEDAAQYEMSDNEDRYKYPRTAHFDWSLSLINDDRRLPSLDGLVGQRVVVTEKFDGENTSLYRDASHARSMDSRHHGSRDWCKAFHGEFAHKIPDGWRVVVENCYATHSIKYRQELGNALPSLAIGLSIWDDKNVCLSWDETLMWFEELDIVPARVLYDGIWDEALFRKMAQEQDPNTVEGYVVRVADAIEYGRWFLPAGKYVRIKHVNTTQHWMTTDIVPNEMMTDEEIDSIRSKIISGRW